MTSPAPRDVWHEILESCPAAFVYQTPVGLDALCASTGVRDASRLYEFRGGRRLVLPLTRRGRGRFAVEESPVVGSVVGAGAIRPDEVRAVLEDLAQRRVMRTVVRPTALESDAWPAAVAGARATPLASHVLDLDGGFETVWRKRFNTKARRHTRRAGRADLEVECDTTGRLIPEFYLLLELSMLRWASRGREPGWLARWRGHRRDPIRRFRALAEVLGDAFRLRVARVEGRPAAAVLVLLGANAHYTRSAMDAELAVPTSAGVLLQKLAIEEACQVGCRYYHMGSTGSPSLATFKESFGAKSYAYSEYVFERFPATRVRTRIRGFAKRILNGGELPRKGTAAPGRP